MRLIGAAALMALLASCTTVRLAERDGCWVRQTSKFLGSSKEELGPCRRSEPSWVQDRYTRLVQECVAEADHRWTAIALSSWERGQPLPEQPSSDKTLEMCMAQAHTAMVAENERLRTALGSSDEQRKDLARRYDTDRAQMLEANAKLSSYLGEAAKKATTPAIATATASSDGKASSENGSDMRAAADNHISGSGNDDAGRARGRAPARMQPLGKRAQPQCSPSCEVAEKDKGKEPQPEARPAKAMPVKADAVGGDGRE